MSVCPAIDSASGHDRDMRPVSLEPEGSYSVQREQNFTEKWPVAKLLKIKVTPLMHFYVKIFLYIFVVHFEVIEIIFEVKYFSGTTKIAILTRMKIRLSSHQYSRVSHYWILIQEILYKYVYQ
jgi:hypothetical protein